MLADLNPKKMRLCQHMPARQHGRQVSNPPYGVAHRIKSGTVGPMNSLDNQNRGMLRASSAPREEHPGRWRDRASKRGR